MKLVKSALIRMPLALLVCGLSQTLWGDSYSFSPLNLPFGDTVYTPDTLAINN